MWNFKVISFLYEMAGPWGGHNVQYIGLADDDVSGHFYMTFFQDQLPDYGHKSNARDIFHIGLLHFF